MLASGGMDAITARMIAILGIVSSVAFFRTHLPSFLHLSLRQCDRLSGAIAHSYLFEFVTHRQIFDFPKLFTYRNFSQLI